MPTRQVPSLDIISSQPLSMFAAHCYFDHSAAIYVLAALAAFEQ
ncbi:MAG TPA: hypothetical protein VKB05_08835 [Pyrinomonadaceae bacterium]|nr:hypothetical protein [Pyrinomonadaceae bacterium]